MRTRVLPVVVLALAAGCGDAPPDEGTGDRERAADRDTAGDTVAVSGAGDTAHEYAYAQDEAERLLAFLRGREPFDPALLADTVTLRVAPEGGGATRRVARAGLADRNAWRAGRFAFPPPDSLTTVQVAPGLHFHCFAGPLAERVPALAGRPHVGVRLEPATDPGCLQTWNLTFVFDGGTAAPRVTDVVYDQWEW